MFLNSIIWVWGVSPTTLVDTPILLPNPHVQCYISDPLDTPSPPTIPWFQASLDTLLSHLYYYVSYISEPCMGLCNAGVLMNLVHLGGVMVRTWSWHNYLLWCWRTETEDDISTCPESYWCVLNTVVGEGHIQLTPSSVRGVCVSGDKCEGKAKYIEEFMICGKQVFIRSWQLALQRMWSVQHTLVPAMDWAAAGWGVPCGLIYSKISEAVDTCSSGLSVLHAQQHDTPGPKSPVCFPF